MVSRIVTACVWYAIQSLKQNRHRRVKRPMWQPQTEYGRKDKLLESRAFLAATTELFAGLAWTVRYALIVPVLAKRSMIVELRQNCGKASRAQVCWCPSHYCWLQLTIPVAPPAATPEKAEKAKKATSKATPKKTVATRSQAQNKR